MQFKSSNKYHFYLLGKNNSTPRSRYNPVAQLRLKKSLEKKRRSHVISSSYLIKILPSLAWCRKCKRYLLALPEDNQRLSFISPFIPITEIAPVPLGKVCLSWSLLPVEGASETCLRGLKNPLSNYLSQMMCSHTQKGAILALNTKPPRRSGLKGQSRRPGHRLFLNFRK